MRHQITTLLLGPVLLCQGMYVKTVIRNLPEPEGDRVGSVGNRSPLKLLIVGDSSAAGVGAETQADALLGRMTQELAGKFSVNFRLEAKSGANTADAIQALEAIEGGAFDVAVTALGVNDVTARSSIKEWKYRQQRLISILGEKFGVKKIILSGLPPVSGFPALPQPLRWYLGSRAKQFDRALRDVAQQSGAVFIPFDFTLDVTKMAEDGFHPGPQIYAEWARRVAEAIILNK